MSERIMVGSFITHPFENGVTCDTGRGARLMGGL